LLDNSRVGPTSLRLWDATGSLTVSVGVVVSSQEKAIRDSVAVLSDFFVGEGTLGETLTRVANLAVACVGPAEMAGITMLVDSRVRTAVFTSAESPEIDSAQYETGEGPCLDAFRHQRVYRIDSTA